MSSHVEPQARHYTSDGPWVVHPGETMFFKKGATVTEQYLETDVCLLMVFIPDARMRTAVREVLTALISMLPMHEKPARPKPNWRRQELSRRHFGQAAPSRTSPML